MIKQLKFKKLLNEYRSVFYELEYVNEALREANHEFEKHKNVFCGRKQVEQGKLDERNSERIKSIYSSSDITKAIVKPKPESVYNPKKIFRQIARKFHPDTLSPEDPRLEEYETVFKKAAAAIDNHSWGDLFDIAERYNLELEDYETINGLLKQEIKLVQNKIDHKKGTYAWLFHCCEGDEDKNDLIRKFLSHLYGSW